MSKKCTLLVLYLVAAARVFAQDSSKVLHHEIGFNAISLLQQVRIFTTTPGQQPYDLFYNIYYRDIIGLRLGLGVFTETALTEIELQDQPRETVNKKLNFRVGVSYNFAHSKHFVFNFFADGLINRSTVETVNTSTVQVFPDPIITRTIRSGERVIGGGVQAGVGLKWNIVRNLSLYTELPVSYTRSYHLIEDEILETGEEDRTERSLTERSGIRIALPITVYLVLRF